MTEPGGGAAPVGDPVDSIRRPRAGSRELSAAAIPLGVLVSIYGLGGTIAALDVTTVSVALETLRRVFDVELAVAQWVVTANLLAVAVVVPVAGWAVARIGAKRAWIVALVVFAAGAVLAACSWSLASLVAARVLQGLGAGLLMPVGQTIVLRSTSRESIGRVLGLVNIPLLVGPVLGPAVGGLLLAVANWRVLFLITLPVCLGAILLAARLLPDDRPVTGRTMDAIGLVLLSPGLAGLLYSASKLADPTPGIWSVLVPAASGALVAAFVIRALRSVAVPLVDLRLLGRRQFGFGAGIAVLTNAANIGGSVIYLLWMQQVLGLSALVAGALLGVQGLGSLVSMIWAGRLADRFGSGAVVPAGAVITAIASVLCAFWVPSLGIAPVIGAMFAFGIGIGATLLPSYSAAYAAVGPEQLPDATTVVNIVSRLGGAYGAALLVVLLAPDGSPVTETAGAFRIVLLGVATLSVLGALLGLFLSRGRVGESPP